MYELPSTSPRFEKLRKRYEDYIDERYESSMLFTIDQDYSPENGKVLYYNEDFLTNDPYGYYSYKNIFYDEKSYGQPFYEDFPVDSYDFKDYKSYMVMDPDVDISNLEQSNVDK